MKTKCELLAPAGGMKQLIAAVENGADAVYMGGHSFNARINADNFTAEEMKQGIEYAHIRNVKVYITVNTLFKDEELEAGLEYAGQLYEMGADALIIQDLGFGSIVRAALPDFPLQRRQAYIMSEELKKPQSLDMREWCRQESCHLRK